MAARNLSVQYGLLVIAAKSEVAIEKAPTMSNMCVGQPDHEVHAATPVTAPKVCVACGPITDYSALVKGVKQGSSYAILQQDDVAEAKDTYAKEHKGVLNLIPHPASEFLAKTAPGDTLHFLTPADAGSANHYQLLVKLIESHPELVFASLYTPVSATAQYVVGVREGVLVMQKRVHSESLKAIPSVGGEVNDALYDMLEATLPAFVTDYDADAYEDKFEKALADMLAKAETVSAQGGEPAKTKAPVTVTDEELLAKLTAFATASATASAA